MRYSIFLIILLISSQAYASFKCKENSFGKTVCEGEDKKFTIEENSFGNKVYKDDNGNKYEIFKPDTHGRQKIKSSDGDVIEKSTNSFGKTTYKDKEGRVKLKTKEDSFGNTVYEDDKGNKVKCKKRFNDDYVCD